MNIYARKLVWQTRLIAIGVFKVVNKLSPIYMHDLFKLKPNTNHLRNFQIIQKSHPGKTYFGHNSVSYDGASIWNSLPNEIKDVSSIKEFSKAIKLWKGMSCKCHQCRSS